MGKKYKAHSLNGLYQRRRKVEEEFGSFKYTKRRPQFVRFAGILKNR